MKQRLTLILCLMALGPTTAFAADKPQPAASSAASSKQKPDLLTVASQSGHFKILLEALDVADLLETLSQDGPYTIFAPNDEAFKKLPQDELTRLLKDKKMLRRILLHHVISGQFDGDSVRKSDGFRSITDEDIELKQLVTEYYFDHQARLVQTDLEGRNGVIHEIDRVLLPPAAFKEDPLTGQK